MHYLATANAKVDVSAFNRAIAIFAWFLVTMTIENGEFSTYRHRERRRSSNRKVDRRKDQRGRSHEQLMSDVCTTEGQEFERSGYADDNDDEAELGCLLMI